VTLSGRIAEFAFQEREIPEGVAACAIDHILDAIGVGLAASSLPTSAGWHAAVRALGAGEEAGALGFAGRLPAPSAALLNGALIHSLEYDDTHTASIVHGSAVVVAAALAAVQRHGASGAELVRAVVAGWEVMIRMGLAAPGAFQRRGFQVTAVGGPFVAALLATLVARTSPREAMDAMGIAGSQAGGVFEFLVEGATVKAMHPGWAAHAGLVAAELAAGGMTGPTTIFEGKHGFYRLYAGDEEAPARLAGLLDSLGSRWLLLEASLKGYPCCHYLHSFLEAAERLYRGGVGAESISAIDCEVPEEEAMLICEPWERKLAPVSGYEAKFSLPYALAVMLCRGEINVATFAGAASDRAALALAQRVRWRPWRGSGFPQRFAAKLSVQLRDGKRREELVPQVRGSPERPFTREEIDAKFSANAALRLGKTGARELREAIRALPGGAPPATWKLAPS
jgi:2-methylcitrate dehydratase PrpD